MLLMSHSERGITARELVRRMLSEYDPFCGVVGTAHAIPLCILYEAWSPERKEEIIKHGRELGYGLVEHAVIGEYDLTLWHSDKTEPPYLVALNSAYHDPLNHDTQEQKQVAGRGMAIKTMKRVLFGWVQEYGPLVIGSVMTEQTARYLRLVRKMFPTANIKSWYSKDFQHGFTLSFD